MKNFLSKLRLKLGQDYLCIVAQAHREKGLYTHLREQKRSKINSRSLTCDSLNKAMMLILSLILIYVII